VKAILRRAYGPPDLLTFEDIPEPTPGDNEVLVKVRAASVNPLDWHFMRGSPYLMRMGTGAGKPSDVSLGADFAGRVEGVGQRVTQFRPGDEVFGSGKGAFAEYALAHKNRLARKPARATFEQAAAVPIAGITALQALRDKGRISESRKVLINGAAGGVGTFAIQIARSFGADVTGVCSTKNLDFVRSIGASHVIDYTREDFTQGRQRYDLILDAIGNHSLLACRRALTSHGTYVVVGGPDGRWLGPLTTLLKVPLLAPWVSQELMMLVASVNTKDLTLLRHQIDTGRMTPVIDTCYSLPEAPEAIRHVETGHARGKVVITV
jgi:NADPH:quinone reductase-like Zn-dependent oxidoreductase